MYGKHGERGFHCLPKHTFNLKEIFLEICLFKLAAYLWCCISVHFTLKNNIREAFERSLYIYYGREGIAFTVDQKNWL